MKGLEKLIYWILRPEIKFTENVIKNTPEHCGQGMEFIGVHKSLFETTATYQCPICKVIGQVKL